MQQDTYFYQNFPQDPRLQYPNTAPFPIQNNPSPWSGNYIPDGNLSQAQNVPNPFNYGNQFQPGVTPISSTAIYCQTPTFSWAHTVPSLMPWVTQCDQNVPDPIMRFTAPFPPDPCTSQTATSWELLNNLGANKTNVNMHLKRKSDLDALEVAAAPHKMCITEEKMAARLRELHISNQYSVPGETSPFGPYNNTSNSSVTEKSITNLQQLEAMLKGSNAEGTSKSLVLAPELKKLVEPEKIFASTFLEKVERPSMAVVLWQPPNKILPNANNNSKTEEQEKEDASPQQHIISMNSDQPPETIPMNKGDNNNFFSQHLSSIGNQYASFTMGTSNVVPSSLSSEDIMDT